MFSRMVGLGRGFFRSCTLVRTDAFQQQKEDGCKHKCERNDLEDATLPGEHKQGCHERA